MAIRGKIKDENIYRRNSDGEFEPIGLYANENILYDGLWYVRHHKYGKEMSNMDYASGILRLGPSVRPEICELAGLVDYTDYILNSDEMKELMKSGYSMRDIVGVCVGKVFEFNKLKDQIDKV